jgi:hypothetical protein
MLSNSHHHVQPANEAERVHLESLIREDFLRCHLGETLEDVKRRAAFSKEDKGLLRGWRSPPAAPQPIGPTRHFCKLPNKETSRIVRPQAARQNPSA